MALDEWRYSLEGTSQPIIIWTDHKNLVLDHLFAEKWTIYTLLDTTRPSDVIGHFVSSIVRHYKSQRALRLIGRGRPKSDVTKGLTSHEVIYECGPFKLSFSRWKPDQQLRIILEERSHVDFIYSPRWPTKRTIHDRGFWNKKARDFNFTDRRREFNT
ncbi:hypothetical protein CRENBAI_026872 [Crenichthys baileyi]|uniref:Reverse transcriptase RNase H-like domain-containing protein n=1 Tax=Crenichthys baileyi TaxID=28760 RepID=A0AAV9RPG7_9TELE